MFQDEVKFLQKIIEKASKKFRRKKFKFDVSKDVKKFFDTIENIGRIDKEIVDIDTRENNNIADLKAVDNNKIISPKAGKTNKTDLNARESNKVAYPNSGENNKIDGLIAGASKNTADLNAEESDKKADLNVGQKKSMDKLMENGEILSVNDQPAHKLQCVVKSTTKGNQTDNSTGESSYNMGNNEVKTQLSNHFTEKLRLNKNKRPDKGNNYQENYALDNKVINGYSKDYDIKSVEYSSIKNKDAATETLNAGNNHGTPKPIVEDIDTNIPSGNIAKFSEESTVSSPLTESDWVKFRDQELHKNGSNAKTKDTKLQSSLDITSIGKDDNVKHNIGKDDNVKHKPDRISVLQELCKRLDTKTNSKILETNSNGKTLDTKNDGKILKTNNNDKMLYSHSNGKRQDNETTRASLQRNKLDSNNVKRVKSKAVGTDDDMFSNVVSHRTVVPVKNDVVVSPRNRNSCRNNEINEVCNVSYDDSNVKAQCSDDSGILNKPKGIIKNWTNDKNHLRRSKSDSSKYSYLRNKKYMEAKKENLRVKFADDIDQFDDTDKEIAHDTDDSVDDVVDDSERDIYLETVNNSINGFQECSRDVSSNFGGDEQQVDSNSELSVSKTVPMKLGRKAESGTMYTEDQAHDKMVVRERGPEDRLLKKFKTALDNFRGSGVVNSNNDSSSNLLATNVDRRKQAIQETGSESKQADQIKFDSGSPTARINTFGVEELENKSNVTEKPKPDMFDLNNFRTTIENLKEEIITTRKKHEKDSTATFVEDSKHFPNKAITEKTGTELSESDAFTNQFDGEFSATKQQQRSDNLTIHDIQNCESPAIPDHHISKSSVTSGEQESEHLAIADHDDSEQSVDKDHVTGHIADHVNDIKAPGVHSPRQTNGLKVSNARIAAYVRRRLKAIELPGQCPATLPLESSLTGSLPKGFSATLNDPASKDSSTTEDYMDSNLDNGGALMAASRSEQTVGSNIKDLVLKHSRTHKQRLPSSKEMLFDS